MEQLIQQCRHSLQEWAVTHQQNTRTYAVGFAGASSLVMLMWYILRRRRRNRDAGNEPYRSDEWYDLVLKIDDFMQVCRKGWLVDDRRVDIEEWKGTVVTVLGEFNKGKTWFLNNLTGSKLPSGVNIRTEGLSFKRMILAKKEIALLDTAGSGSPVRSVTPAQLQQKKAMEKFLRDVVFECADIFLYVVNDISAEEQIELHSLALSLEQSTKDEKRILVIHNLRERSTEEDMKEAVDKIVQMYTSTGCYVLAPEEITDDFNGERNTIDVLSGLKEYRLAKYQLHLFIGKEGTPAGRLNSSVFSKVRQVLNTCSAKREYRIQEKIIQSFQVMLPKYIEGPKMQLCLLPDETNQHPRKFLRVFPEGKFLPPDVRTLLLRLLKLLLKQQQRYNKPATSTLGNQGDCWRDNPELGTLLVQLLECRPQIGEIVAEYLVYKRGTGFVQGASPVAAEVGTTADGSPSGMITGNENGNGSSDSGMLLDAAISFLQNCLLEASNNANPATAPTFPSHAQAHNVAAPSGIDAGYTSQDAESSSFHSREGFAAEAISPNRSRGSSALDAAMASRSRMNSHGSAGDLSEFMPPTKVTPPLPPRPPNVGDVSSAIPSPGALARQTSMQSFTNLPSSAAALLAQGADLADGRDELEAGLYKLKPQPLPCFLSAETSDGGGSSSAALSQTPPYTVSEAVDALWIAVELPGVDEPRLHFRPNLEGGGFLFTVTAQKANPLPSNAVLRTHCDTRVLGSSTRPLRFSFIVPSVFEMPQPDGQGHFAPIGEFSNGVLLVRFKKLPVIDQPLTVTRGLLRSEAGGGGGGGGGGTTSSLATATAAVAGLTTTGTPTFRPPKIVDAADVSLSGNLGGINKIGALPPKASKFSE